MSVDEGCKHKYSIQFVLDAIFELNGRLNNNDVDKCRKFINFLKEVEQLKEEISMIKAGNMSKPKVC